MGANRGCDDALDVDLEYHNAMGTKAIDPHSIRNVTIIGDPEDTTPVAQRLLRCFGRAAHTIHWSTGRVEHTIRLTELSSHAPNAELERSIRVANGVLAVVNAAEPCTPQLETMLRVADDHQVARLCLVTGLDHPAADFERCVRTIADTRGAVPLTVQIPLGVGPEFEGIIDLAPMWSLEPLAIEFFGTHWEVAEHWFHDLVRTVTDHATPDATAFPTLQALYHRIRTLTRLGEVVPILCAMPVETDDIAPLLDAIVRYLPSPLDVCQPEHALDY